MIKILIFILGSLFLANGVSAQRATPEPEPQAKVNLELCVAAESQIRNDLVNYLRLLELRIAKVNNKRATIEKYYNEFVVKKGKSLKNYNDFQEVLDSFQSDLKEKNSDLLIKAYSFACSENSGEEIKEFKLKIKGQIKLYQEYKLKVRNLIARIVPLLPPEEVAKYRRLRNINLKDLEASVSASP